MRFLVMVKATPDAESGRKPSRELMEAMGRFNDELVKAGVLKDADGLKASKHGARVKFGKGGGKTLVDGPFAETKELVAGFWIWECASREEALRWAMKCPPPFEDQDCEIEVRPVISAEEFAEMMK